MGDARGTSSHSEQPVPIEVGDGGLALLVETIHDLTSTLSIDEVMQRLLRRVLFHLDSEIASILLVEPDQRLRIKHARGLPDDVVSNTILEPGQGISGHVVREGVSILIEDVETHPTFRRRNHERYYTSSAISVPLRIQGRVMGVINVNNKRDRTPHSPEDLRLIEAIAGHAAVALTNAHRFEETLQRAQNDALTGLSNHGHFWSTLRAELERARRYGRKLSLTLADVDHFKAFNDSHGHVSGDEALAGVAGVLRDRSRVHDTPARYGGEEFAVILPETGPAGARVFAEKIRGAVEHETFPGAEPGELTISAGVATFPVDAERPEELVEAADRRLYRAKDAGRNRVCAED